MAVTKHSQAQYTKEALRLLNHREYGPLSFTASHTENVACPRLSSTLHTVCTLHHSYHSSLLTTAFASTSLTFHAQLILSVNRTAHIEFILCRSSIYIFLHHAFFSPLSGTHTGSRRSQILHTLTHISSHSRFDHPYPNPLSPIRLLSILPPLLPLP